MGQKIKSALEMALEKTANLNVDQQEIIDMELEQKGSEWAAKFLQSKSFDLTAALKEVPQKDLPAVIKGARETFLRNIQPPSDAVIRDTNKRAMEGLMLLTDNKQHLKEIFGEMEYLFQYYVQAVQQVYAAAKNAVEQRLAQAQHKLEQQLGVRVKVKAENRPEFQIEYQRALGQLNSQYEEYLNHHKDRVRSVL
ncbi:MAG: hypothetical protein H0Z39_02145 [Peptococcaceae bacterium]|nr:hypothetical protein [Peptococcaceae bacterium]